MATTDNNVQYDIKLLEELLPYLGYSKKEKQDYLRLVPRGHLQVDRIAEEAMSNLGTYDAVSIAGMDFSDASDSKTVVSQMRNNDKKRGRWIHSFEVQNIHTKVGALRVVGYNKVLDKFHYFYIPRHAYEHLTFSISIVLEQYTNKHDNKEPAWTGIPQKKSRKFWAYECESFLEMATKTG